MKEINKDVFNGCIGLTGSLIIPENIKSIGLRSFYNCSSFDGTLTLPSSLKQIANESFTHTNFNIVIFEGSSSPL